MFEQVANSQLIYALIALVVACIISGVGTKLLIPFLKEHQLKQYVREVGPQSHLSKTGTPSMGGIAITIAIIVATLVLAIVSENFSIGLAVVLVVMVLHALMGFIDDYTKATQKKNDGLSAKKKLLIQFLVSLGFAVFAYYYSGDYLTKFAFSEAVSNSSIYIPFWGGQLELGWFYIPWVTFVMMAFSNSVNLTDGLDGLASGVTTLVSFAMIIGGCALGYMDQPIFLGAMAGACIGFLFLNRHPAKIFMGDTGSMALGGGLAACCIMMKLEIVLAIAGLVYVCESLSVIIQVTYFKATHGKRIFRMSPIHHHFELGGMPEQRVVYMFWAATLVFSLIAIFSVR